MVSNNTFITYFGDGSTTSFAIPFTYNKKSEVVVLVDSVDYEGRFTFLNDQTLSITPAPARGAVITVKRDTNIQTAEIVWKNGSNTTSAQLNIMVRQLLNGLQEAKDTAERGIFADVDGTFDFHNYRIKNLGDPINPQDAATKHWTETALSSGVVQAREAAQAALSSANTAQAHRNSASASASQASTSATSAGTSATQASNARIASEGARDASVVAKTASEAARDAALSARTAAQNASTAASTSSSTATAAATSAENSKTAAATSAANAHASELAAKAYAEQTLVLVEGEGYLTHAGNLAGIANPATARSNLGLGTAATQSDDRYPKRVNNLSDLTDAAAARVNLGLQSGATLAASSIVRTANNLNDLANASVARTNLGLGEAATRADSYFLCAANSLSELSSTAAKTAARANIGLDQVNNTSDADKPISTAMQTALNGKAATSHTHTIANITNLQASLDAKASTTTVNDKVSRVGIQEYVEYDLDVNNWVVAPNDGLVVVGIRRNALNVGAGVANGMACRRIVQNVPSLGGWVWINRN